MKKIMLLLFIACLNSVGICAQAKQRKVLLLQIAALQTYIGYAKKGYTVVKNGLNFIEDAKKGEINLHNDYFTSLGKVNPRVKNYIKVAEIISLQIKIIKTYKKTSDHVREADLFHGNELDYIERTFNHLIDNCSDTLDQLLIITTDTKLEMKDDQRIERIDRLYKVMIEHYSFCKDFSQDINLITLSKVMEKNDAKQSEILLGL